MKPVARLLARDKGLRSDFSVTSVGRTGFSAAGILLIREFLADASDKWEAHQASDRSTDATALPADPSNDARGETPP